MLIPCFAVVASLVDAVNSLAQALNWYGPMGSMLELRFVALHVLVLTILF